MFFACSSDIRVLLVNLEHTHFEQVVKFVDALKNVLSTFEVYNAEYQAKVLK